MSRRQHINNKLREKAKELPKLKSLIRKSTENEIKLANPEEFFKKINTPVESKLFTFVKDVKEKSEEMLDTNGISKIMEIHPGSGKWRWRIVKNTAELKEAVLKSEAGHSAFMKMREQRLHRFLAKKEDTYGGDNQNNIGAFPNRAEFTPVIGSPFYKQMYLYDYWEMHSKCFWYSNYSGIAKLIVDITRNFVMGRGFNVSFKDQKAQDAWDKYADRSNIFEEARYWCDDLTKFGEVMIKKIPGSNGITHKSFDPSTIWEIVTDPENINDVKYYHQQYNTQYQLYTAPAAPTAKYIINQIPPELVIHGKINVTPYEKRGRSDLLAPLLYFKLYEDFMQAKMIRAKNEAAFIWDVTIDGSDEDVQAYINGTESIMDVPPGSENVHNAMVDRKPLSPTFGAAGQDETAAEILSYIAMSVNIPYNYFGTARTSGTTKAGALVGTEPVAKKMVERQLKMEMILRRVIKDVLIDAGINPKDPKNTFEINWPEIMEEDSTTKIGNLILAKQNNAIAHRTMSEMVSKELKITKYDYDAEIKLIKQEQRDPALFELPGSGLTNDDNDGDNQSDRQLDRPGTKDQNTSY